MVSLYEKTRKLIKELDPKMKEKERDFVCSQFVLSSAFKGPNSYKIRRLLNHHGAEITLDEMQQWASNLKQSRVWKHGKVCVNWADESEGSISFFMDVNIAQGYIKRSVGNTDK